MQDPKTQNLHRHMRLGSPYEKAIAAILARGGDTDTNAAIVGGLAGALHGVESIPAHMREPVLARGPESPGRRVADFIVVREVPALVSKMMAGAGW